MTEIAIVYYSGFGHTKKIAEEIAKGAEASGAAVTLFDSDTATERLDDLDNSDAIIFGSPTYMGGVAGPFKVFTDATSKKWASLAWKDKIAAGFTNSGSYSGDKQGTLIYLMTFAMQHGMIWVGLPEMTRTEPEDEGETTREKRHGAPPEAINRLGSFSGLMAQSDNAPPEETPSPGDIKTAHLFGKRVAEATERWINARS